MQIKIDTVSNVFSITRNDLTVTGKVRPDPVFEPAGSMSAQTMTTMRTIAKLVLSEDDATRTSPATRASRNTMRATAPMCTCFTGIRSGPCVMHELFSPVNPALIVDHSDRTNGYAPFNANTEILCEVRGKIEVYRLDCECEYCEDTRVHHGWPLLKGAQCKSS